MAGASSEPGPTSSSSEDIKPKQWRYVLFGSVLPPAATLELSAPLRLQLNHSNAGVVGKAFVILSGRQVIFSIDCDAQVGNLYTLRNVCADAISVVPNCVNLLQATTTEIHFTSVHAVEENYSLVFHIGFQSIAKQKGIGISQVNINDILPVATGEPSFARALENFRLAIREGADTGFFCQRAVESLAHYFGAMRKKSDRYVSVNRLLASLGFEAEIGSELARWGGGVRHGAPEWFAEPVREKLLQLIQTMLIRFSEYYQATKLKGGAPPTFEIVKP